MNLNIRIKLKEFYKRTIKINDREKILIVLLIFLIIMSFLLKSIFLPQRCKIQYQRNIIKQHLDRINYFRTKLEEDRSIEKEVNDLRYEYESLSKIYYSDSGQADIIHELNSIIDSGNLIISNIIFMNPEIIRINDASIGCVKVSLAYRGGYVDLNHFIRRIKENENKLIIKQLLLIKSDDNNIQGQIVLETYFLNDFKSNKGGFFYKNNEEPNNKTDPFKDLYEKELTNDEEKELNNEIHEKIIVENMESDDISFMGTSYNVEGNVKRFNKSEDGKVCTRMEYSIASNFQSERANIVLDDRNILFKYPPDLIGINIFSYGYSPIIIGLTFQDLDGQKIDIEISKGVNWIGWNCVESTPPSDINLYPLKLKRIYLELGPNKDDYGVMLFDSIEARYPKIEDAENYKTGYVFHTIKPGETIEDISKKYYGTEAYSKRLLDENGLKSNKDLESYTVLVIKNRK